MNLQSRSDHGAYNDYNDDAHSDLEDDCNSLASFGGSSINFEEAYDDSTIFCHIQIPFRVVALSQNTMDL